MARSHRKRPGCRTRRSPSCTGTPQWAGSGETAATGRLRDYPGFDAEPTARERPAAARRSTPGLPRPVRASPTARQRQVRVGAGAEHDMHGCQMVLPQGDQRSPEEPGNGMVISRYLAKPLPPSSTTQTLEGSWGVSPNPVAGDGHAASLRSTDVPSHPLSQGHRRVRSVCRSNAVILD